MAVKSLEYRLQKGKIGTAEKIEMFTIMAQCYKTFYIRDLQIFILSSNVFWTMLEKLARDKRSGFIWKFIIYIRKKLYNLGPWAQCYKTFLSVIYEIS